MATAPFAVTDRSYQTLHSVGAVCNRKAMLSHILVGAVGDREPMHNRILVGAVGDREPS